MSFKPDFNCTFDAYSGYRQTPPFANRWMGKPCALWHSRGRETPSTRQGEPPITLQLATDDAAAALSYYGWNLNSGDWDGGVADWWIVTMPGGKQLSVQPVHEGPMWAGTPDFHWRFSCTLALNHLSVSYLLTFPPLGLSGRPLDGGRYATFDLYRPFGAAVPTLVAAPGVLYPDPYGGRGSYSGGNYLLWSDVLDCADSVDVRDGLARAGGLDTLTFSNGDEVRFPTGVVVTRYVVVLVKRVGLPDGSFRKRVYLLRDQPAWPGP